MNTIDFHDRRFCSECRTYVHYLQSLNAAYCVDCGEKVKLFSPDDLAAFQRSVLRLEASRRDLRFHAERASEQTVA